MENKIDNSDRSGLVRVTSPSPSQSMTKEVYATARLKRKRTSVSGAGSSLKPVLKGSLVVSSGKVVFSGCWALTTESFECDFNLNSNCKLIKAPFYYERKSIASAASTTVVPLPMVIEEKQSSKEEQDMQVLRDGIFSGYFCMQDLTQKNCTFIKHFENDILLRFSNTEVPKVYDVVGSGENKFGKFIIEGRFNSSTGEIACARNYLPKLKKNSKAEGESEPGNHQPRRSSRERIPSERFRESHVPDDLKREFNGRTQMILILKEFLSKIELLQNTYDVSGFHKLINDLEQKEVKSLKIGLQRAMNGFKKLDDIKLVSKYETELQQLSDKMDPHKQNSKLEEKDEPVSGEYVSLFDNTSVVEEIDPLCWNLAAEFPAEVKYPALVDLASSFNKKDLEPKVFDDDPMDQFDDDDDEDFADLYPISAVDFSDLSDLDVETLKSLNELVEFSCPSKGA